MKGRKRSLGWYVGMGFGDPAALADPDAPEPTPGGPWWMYVIMWLVIGSILGLIPALVLWRIYWAKPEAPGPAQHGATAVFDGTYVGVEKRLIDDRKLIGRCSPGDPPGRLTISDGVIQPNTNRPRPVRARGRSPGKGGGHVRNARCTYHVLWKKE